MQQQGSSIGFGTQPPTADAHQDPDDLHDPSDGSAVFRGGGLRD